MRQHAPFTPFKFLQTLVGLGVVLLALGLAAGALSIPSNAGYAGIGPNFLPWLVTGALLLCSSYMLYKARTGGFRNMEEPKGEQPYWGGFAWIMEPPARRLHHGGHAG